MSNAPVVDFYFDYASPWSYLADCIRERAVPGAEFTLRPTYLRGFPAFAKGMPYDQTRLRYIGRDILRCTKRWNVELTFPSNFPVNGVHGLRAMVYAQKHQPERALDLHGRLFRAAWLENKNISDREVVSAICKESGVEAALDDEAIKEELKIQTAAAAARGAFGVPSFFYEDELFFGHDRLDYLAEAIAKAK